MVSNHTDEVRSVLMCIRNEISDIERDGVESPGNAS